MKPVWNVDNEWLCSPNHAYLIEREKVQATVFEKPSSARAIVSSFWSTNPAHQARLVRRSGLLFGRDL